MNKGTREGTEEEIKFVKLLNSDKKNKLWKILGFKEDCRNLFAVHVTDHKEGKINRLKIKPKADAIICEGEMDEEQLRKKDFYLKESEIKKLKFRELDFSGISIKRKDSKRYQILKMNPSTFRRIFGNRELGAGASIYCRNEEDLEKNDSVLRGWGTDWDKFDKFFGIKGKPDIKDFVKIKKYATKEIFNSIDTNKRISDFVFKGVGNFEEPFTATWFYERGELKKAGKIPFSVTTGSGRSHGDFTIVVKPA